MKSITPQSCSNEGIHAQGQPRCEVSLRVGGVVYLNARPLLWAIPTLCPRAKISYDIPSRLADRLAHGELDVAIVPVIEAFRDPAYVVVSDACIAAADLARSVVIFSRMPLADIRTLALDTASRTSAVVARLILAEKYGIQPDLVGFPLEASPADLSCDAMLLIGDRAMTVKSPPFPYVYDLAAEWRSWTGLPLVFAVWVAQPAENDWKEIAATFARARDEGVNALDKIADQGARELGLPFAICYEYLSKNLHFTLGIEEYESLRLFGRLAAKHGFVPEGRPLRFIS